jgi:ribonuclease E
MTKRMLIDASHAEETRVVVLDGTRLEEFDLEAATRKPLKGNIYLAKVVRVEPSLQAAFVEYGGNRHGFLAFGEIHPDYYQIPVADRQRLIAMQEAEAREEAEAEAAAEAAAEAGTPAPAPVSAAEIETVTAADPDRAEEAPPPVEPAPAPVITQATDYENPFLRRLDDAASINPDFGPHSSGAGRAEAAWPVTEPESSPAEAGFEADVAQAAGDVADAHAAAEEEDEDEEAPPPETLGGEGPEAGEGGEDMRAERRQPPRFMRHYKIQEVIRRRQIMLVQVVKEERGTKGAALTTYISLAGRFSVLMPNSPRGGGVSRKITSANDRKRLREVIDELDLPQGMSLIVRTAGAQRPKPEIRRDCEYLLRLWDNIRERTLASSAPALIYEEADLIKRSIRDVFSRDVEEILVDGEDAFRDAREFMRMLMPQHARKIQLHRDGGLFARHQVEQQLDAMHSPTVQLRSGGYVVINQTEALVAIDVNSGRSTRERHIEDTALRTNLEAADEIARQLRLRDLAGLIVIDFIDMESGRHDAMVERRLKEALRHDRARIQVGRISHFGLLEMSRQRLRPSLAETSFVTCPHCAGRGTIRSIESSALQVLRAIEDEAAKRRSAEIAVHAHSTVALYLLNRKRDRLAQIEERHGLTVVFETDDTLSPPTIRIERLRAAEPGRPVEARPAALRMDYAPDLDPAEAEPEAEAEEADEDNEGETEATGSNAGRAETEAEGRRRRRRRRRRTGPRADGAPGQEEDSEGEGEGAEGQSAEPGEARAAPEIEADGEGEPTEEGSAGDEDERGPRRRRRRGRGRGERGERRDVAAEAPVDSDPVEPVPQRYQGPTPADPFAGQVDDILAAMEAAEVAAEAEANVVRRQRAAEPATESVPPGTTIPIFTVPPEPPGAAPATPDMAVGETMPPLATPAGAVPEPMAPEPEPEVIAAPPAQPLSVDALVETAPRKRGWWRR